jgi:hypothetical protein
MPVSDASTQRTQALALLKRRAMTRPAEFQRAGITTVSRMERAGEVVRLARGLYQFPNAALDAQQSLAEAARLVPLCGAIHKCPKWTYGDASRTTASQRRLPIANGSFMEAQFQSFADPLAVIHLGQHRALSGH